EVFCHPKECTVTITFADLAALDAAVNAMMRAMPAAVVNGYDVWGKPNGLVIPTGPLRTIHVSMGPPCCAPVLPSRLSYTLTDGDGRVRASGTFDNTASVDAFRLPAEFVGTPTDPRPGKVEVPAEDADAPALVPASPNFGKAG